jgi:hypothetical protein
MVHGGVVVVVVGAAFALVDVLSSAPQATLARRSALIKRCR